MLKKEYYAMRKSIKKCWFDQRSLNTDYTATSQDAKVLNDAPFYMLQFCKKYVPYYHSSGFRSVPVCNIDRMFGPIVIAGPVGSLPKLTQPDQHF